MAHRAVQSTFKASDVASVNSRDWSQRLERAVRLQQASFNQDQRLPSETREERVAHLQQSRSVQQET